MNLETKTLDKKIFSFISTYRNKPAPRALFQALAFDIFDYQFRRNEPYRKFCLAKGMSPEQLSRWQDIPAMPVMGFKELSLRTFPVQKAVMVFRTSGTTFQKRGRHFFDTVKLYEASIIPPFIKYCLTDHARCVFYFMTARPGELPESSLSTMLGIINRRLGHAEGRFYVHRGRRRHAELARDLASEKRPVLLFSTALGLAAFLDYLEEKKIVIRLAPKSRLVETGGLKGSSAEISKGVLRASCKRWLGISKNFFLEEYGMTELSSQFYTSTLEDRQQGICRKPLLIGPAWTRTLVIDPKTGRETKEGCVGLLRHFDLANRGSVLAIQTEDRGRRRAEGFELVGRLSGAELRGCSLTYEDFNDQ